MKRAKIEMAEILFPWATVLALLGQFFVELYLSKKYFITIRTLPSISSTFYERVF